MYTHVGMTGLDDRDGLDVDPILNRNRKWHAVNHQGGDSYKALCGVRLIAVDPEESAWGARVMAKDARRVTCKRCRGTRAMAQPQTAN
jgi:hypothetical protein